MFLYVRSECSFCHYRVLAVISTKLLNLSMCFSFPKSNNRTDQCLLGRTKTQMRANPRREPTRTNRHITNRNPDLSLRFRQCFCLLVRLFNFSVLKALTFTMLTKNSVLFCFKFAPFLYS